MRQRLVKLSLVALAVLGLIALVRGLLLLGYEPIASNAYLWGAFHVHTSLSDGLLPLEDVAREARRARVDFVLLSDHGAPHPKAALIQETIEGVRFLGGSEVGVPEGHLIVSDVDALPPYKLPPYPPEAVEDVSEWGGFTVVTYPEDPTHRWLYWEQDFLPQGLEIINVTSYFRASSTWQKLRWAFFSLFNPRYYISGFEAPAYALRRWDELLRRGPVFAFYAANAHGGFALAEGLTVPVPSYATAFSYVGLGVDRRHREAPEEAIRGGDFFAIVRAAGEPSRFEFGADAGGHSHPPGSFVPAGALLRVRLDAPGLAPRITLKRNGAIVDSLEGGKELRFEAADPGVYRAEVYLRDHPLLSPRVPWILSNPIFVGVDYPRLPEDATECDSVKSLPLEELHLEKDRRSTASLSWTESGELELSYHLSQATPEEVDRWIALALREPLDLSEYRGIHLEASSADTMRYWIELRAGERSHYASFKLKPQRRNRLVIPWRRFYATFDGRTKIPLSEIDSLFVTINTSNSRTGFSSKMTLRGLGFCG